MNYNKILTALFALLVFAATPGYATKGRVKSLNASDISITGKSVELTPAGLIVRMDLVLDSLKMKAAGRLYLTPSLRGEGEEVRMPQVIINGRKQQIEYERRSHRTTPEDATVVRRHNGREQTVHYTATLVSEPWMRSSDLVLYADLCGCGDAVDSEQQCLWQLRSPRVEYVRPEAKPKNYELAGSAFIEFPVNKTELHPDYRNNPSELAKIVGTVNNVKEDPMATITSITIKGWASPESPYDHNASLAQGRAQTLTDYVRAMVELPESVFHVTSEPENWIGLRQMVEESEELSHKSEILALIDTDMNADEREAQIRSKYPSDYSFMLANYYPALRRSDYTVSYVVRSFTVEEARKMLAEDPRRLSQEELYLVAQECEPGTDEFNDIFLTAVRLFPDDATANLNAACAELDLGDMATAEQYLAHAGQTPQADNARGVLAYRKGDIEAARALFQKAAEGRCATAAENLSELMRTY